METVATSFQLPVLDLYSSMPLVLAQLDFPRGPGYYFSIFKLVLILIAFFAWIRLASWVDEDIDTLELRYILWNSLFMGVGVVGMFFIWISPMFWLAYLAMIGLTVSVALIYVGYRNQRVPAEERLLTERHLKQLAQQYLRVRMKIPAIVSKGISSKKGKAAYSDDLEDVDQMQIRFIGRSSSERSEDPNRVLRAAESRGYRAALKMVYEAVEKRATDIHLEPAPEEMSVRFRIDGVMHTVDPFSRGMGDAVINIFKVLSDMDITEKRKPQDGSFHAEVEDRSVDFRVATAGSVQGEKMVMRILDRSRQIISLTRIGMRERMRELINSIVTQPHGLFLVCGPTGSGKSTTLYACLNEIDRHQQNIITIENPVEYQLENVTQIEVNLKTGKTFAAELRSILRQDPDVIMIGEIRDKETAEIACQAAQTGHMVFSTLHSNDTVGAIGRLIDLGVQPFLVASSLTAVLGQRLVRVLCPKCKVKYRPNPDVLKKAKLSPDKIKFFYRSPNEGNHGENDCSYCAGTGHYGRTGIFELLAINDPIRDLIRQNPNLLAIKQEAMKQGMRYLYEDGFRQVIEGKTSIQELMRVCN